MRSGSAFHGVLSLRPLRSLRLNIRVVERRGIFAAFPSYFPAAKVFYDLRLDLRFVCYNGCELNDRY